MAKQNYIVDLQALYECLQFLPRVRVDGVDMVSIEDVLSFLDYFPKTPTNVATHNIKAVLALIRKICIIG